uniref:Uncharacterized protein n=1 Tax=Ananas comosus var. bracteatus TaxID=296719 RepID=A0A6V7NJN9_ANACO|nr:unnamed protein product [Ananas comosus var. bracteatus]
MSSSDWLCSELFQIFWWVVDCVPTYGTCPEICGTKPCTQNPKKRDLADSRIEFWRACTGTRWCLYRYKVDGCTGTAIGACTGTEPQSPATRASGLDFVDLVPVQGPVYRYKAADFVQSGLQGCFCYCSISTNNPTPPLLFPELGGSGEKSLPLREGLGIARKIWSRLRDLSLLVPPPIGTDITALLDLRRLSSRRPVVPVSRRPPPSSLRPPSSRSGRGRAISTSARRRRPRSGAPPSSAPGNVPPSPRLPRPPLPLEPEPSRSERAAPPRHRPLPAAGYHEPRPPLTGRTRLLPARPWSGRR